LGHRRRWYLERGMGSLGNMDVEHREFFEGHRMCCSMRTQEGGEEVGVLVRAILFGSP
jgi:hypothetical protein